MLDRIVEPLAYGPETDAGNFWRRTTPEMPVPRLVGAVHTDFAVIGAGFTGLNAALHLAEAGADVTLIDAHGPGWGASGRNGGFCCLGGAALGDNTIRRQYGEVAAQAYFDTERTAIDTVEERLATLGIDAERHSQGETLLAHTPDHLAHLRAHADAINRRYGTRTTLLPRDALVQQGMASSEFHGAITVPIGFALNPARYSLGLALAAQARSVRFFGDSPVTAMAPAAAGFRLTTPNGTLNARKVLVATNGYSSENMPPWLKGRYLPTQSNILVTRPLSDEEIGAQGWSSAQMCYDTRYHLHYFRLMPQRAGENGRRLLFGVRGRVRSSREVWDDTRAVARKDFERIFPAWRHVETPHFWQGLLCLSRKLTPFVGPIPGMDGAYAALAYHGNGVAMGSHAGRLMAGLALGEPAAIPAVMAAPLRRFPLGRHRRWLLWGAWHAHRLQDQLRKRG